MKVPKCAACGHLPVHHDKRKTIYQGIMIDYKVIWACGWTDCGCPRYVPAPPETDFDESVRTALREATKQEGRFDHHFLTRVLSRLDGQGYRISRKETP